MTGEMSFEKFAGFGSLLYGEAPFTMGVPKVLCFTVSVVGVIGSSAIGFVSSPFKRSHFVSSSSTASITMYDDLSANSLDPLSFAPAGSAQSVFSSIELLFVLSPSSANNSNFFCSKSTKLGERRATGGGTT